MKKKQTADRELGNRSFLSKIEPYLYLLPFAIGIAVFTLYPVINVVLMSFKEGYSHLSRNFDQWGLANYRDRYQRSQVCPGHRQHAEVCSVGCSDFDVYCRCGCVSAQSETALFCIVPDGVFPADGHLDYGCWLGMEADVQQELWYHQLLALFDSVLIKIALARPMRQ